MSDDLPTPERLGRIERGVQRRIDRRRQVARQIAGASVAVVLLVGGVALVRPLLVFSSSGAASSAGGTSKEVDGTAAGSSASGIRVICHDGSVTTTVQAKGALPASALTACATATGQSATAARPDDLSTTPTPTPTPVLCESTKGIVHVYLRDSASCATHRLHPYGG